MRVLFAAALGVAVVAASSCGGQQAAPATVTLPPAPPPSAQPIAPAAPSLDPVDPPAGLIATIRLSRPRHALEQWSSLVTSLGAPNLALDLDAFAEFATGARVLPALDLDAPIDGVAMIGGAGFIPGGAVSIAMSPGDAAMELFAQSFVLMPRSDGVIEVRRAPDAGAGPADDDDAGDDDGSPTDGTKCIIAPAAGPAARRLVCATSGVDVDKVAPYLTHNLAREPASQTVDLRAEMLLGPQREAIRQLEGLADGATQDPNGDPVEQVTSRVAKEMATSFVDDLDALVFEATSDDQALTMSATLRFGHAISPLTKALLSNSAAAAPPQDAFWRLPADTTFAWFSRGAIAGDLDTLRDPLLEGLSDLLTADGAPKACADLAMRSFRAVFLTGGPYVVGAGYDFAGARRALASYVALGKDTLAARTKARAAMQGWTLVEVDEPASRWIGALKDAAAADKIKYKGKLPTSVESADREKTTLEVTPTPKALALPSGTFHIEWRSVPVAPKKRAGAGGLGDKTAPIAHTTHVFVVPDGASTWMAAGEDAAVVAAHVRAALSGAPPAGTMAGKAGLERLVGQRSTSGGFATLAWIVQAVADDTSDSDLKQASTWLEKVANVPAKGETPVETYIAPVAAGEGSVGGRTTTWRLPRAALIDAVKSL